MRITLVNAGFEKGEPGVRLSPPLGLMCIAAFLRQASHQVTILDWSGEELGAAHSAQLRDSAPQLVGFSVIVGSSLTRSKKGSEWAKGLGAKVVWGGPATVFLPGIILAQAPVDYLVIGEGELTILELCQELEQGRDGRSVAGLAYLKEGRAHFTEPRARIKNLDALPFPAWDLVQPLDRYFTYLEGKVCMPMTTSRGCSSNCAFCYNRRMWGSQWTARSAEKAIEEIALLQKLEPRIKGAVFDDDLFSGDPARIREFCRLLKERKVELVWNCEMRAPHAQDELVGLMRSAGCREVLVGVESGSQELLDKLRKGLKVAQIEEAFAVMHRHHINVVAMLIIGCPGETWEHFEQTRRLLERIKPDGYFFSLYLPLPGTPLYEDALASGFSPPTDLEGWAALGNIEPENYQGRSYSQIPTKEALDFVNKAMLKSRRRRRLHQVLFR